MSVASLKCMCNRFSKYKNYKNFCSDESKRVIMVFLKTDGREMIGPDGRPLFAYQMSQAEFDDLGRFLSSCMCRSFDLI